MNPKLQILHDEATAFATVHAEGQRAVAQSQGTTWNDADHARALKQLEISYVLRDVLPSSEQLDPVYKFVLDVFPNLSAAQRDYLKTYSL